MPQDFAKVLIFLGLGIAAVGAVFLLLGRAGFRGLPGDITVQREGFSLSFPIVTCIVISIVLTVVINLFGRR